ncbi:MAG: serine/threonine protein kinase [Planctomycetes bacterium]|nr:serine/threonine protein kinase [Planctomycetota bacterium]
MPNDNKEFIPGFLVLGKIGAGGMATVFKGQDSKNKRLVAIKMLHPQHTKNHTELNRFVRESKLLMKFRHPNIVQGYQFGTLKGVFPYLIMEYVEGQSIQQLLDSIGPFPEDFALSVITQIAKALDYMESQNIIHRDIKPDNVLVLEDGTVKLIDLGFAKPIGCSIEDVTENTTCGTPQYMSPEQSQGMKDLDVRSDIYSLGATLFHIVVGKVPFSGNDSLEVMSQQVLAGLKSSDVKSRRISKQMHYFIEKMMAKEKDLRYQSPAEAIEEIESIIDAQKQMEFHPEDYEN